MTPHCRLSKEKRAFERRPQLGIFNPKKFGITYVSVGYAVFLASSGMLTAPIKFQMIAIVCFFVLVPGTFSGC